MSLPLRSQHADAADEQVTEQYLWADTKVYWRHDMSRPERLAVFLLGAAAGAGVGWIFYGVLPLALVAAAAVGIVAVKLWRSRRIKKQMQSLRLQFRDLLESLASSIGAGRNIPDSFEAAQSDLSELYSADADIVREVRLVLAGLRNGVQIETLLSDLAARSRVAEIQTFADIFVVVREKGGDMKSVVENTYAIINEKTEIDLEVETMISSGKSELNMMAVMPIIFAVILNTMGGLGGGPGLLKYLSATAALIVFGVAYWLGLKIMNVEA
ncbi:MAG: type II secretion system F family protein [Bifidobacteriaceae bacterium]|jgi:tight adherence protein B|nr:type II secretion system F family protein [Bifidobacteriaceae bacterium]